MGQASQATFFVATRVQNIPPFSEHSCSPGFVRSPACVSYSLLAQRDAIIGENVSDESETKGQRGAFLTRNGHTV